MVDIEKAAAEYSGGILGFRTVNSVMVKHVSFSAGAKWRINSVWHDAKETPQERRFCLYILKDGSYGCGYYHKRDNTILYDQFENVEKWAYFDDLIPNK